MCWIWLSAKRMHEISQLNLRSSKRKEVWRNYDLAVFSPVLSTSDLTTVTLEDTRSESSSSRNPLPQYLTQTTTYISSSERDDSSIVNEDGLTTNDNAHQSFDHLDSASSYQSNVTNEADESFSSQCSRHDDQHIASSKERSNSQFLFIFFRSHDQDFDLESDMRSTANFSYVSIFQVSIDEPLDLESDMRSTANFSYVSAFQISIDESLDLESDMRSTANFPYVSTFQISIDEPLDLESDMRSTANFSYVSISTIFIDEPIDLESEMGFAMNTISYNSTYF